MYNDDHAYYNGVSNVIYAPVHGVSEAWVGVREVQAEENESSQKIIYVDGEGRTISYRETDFEASVSCYSFPAGIEHTPFNMMYRVERSDTAFEIHIIYNCTAQLDVSSWSTMDDDPNAITFTLNLKTLPAKTTASGIIRHSHIIIRSNDMPSTILEQLEDLLYGSDNDDPYLPSIDELIEFLENKATLRIIDHGDGTWTATGPDNAVKMISATEFQISWPSAIVVSPDSYIVSSL